MLYILSVIIIFLLAYQLNRFLHYERFFDWLIGFVLFVFANNVFIFTIAGIFKQMNNQTVVLGVQALLLVLGCLIVRVCNRKTYPFPPIRFQFKKIKEFPVSLLIFLAVVIGFLGLNVVYVLFAAPNNNDSLMIHLARVGMWHQTGSWLPWNTSAIWQLTFPFNGEIMAYWSLLFLKQESLLGIFPLVCGGLSMGLIYRLGIVVFKEKKNALLAALVWFAFPVVQLNLSSSRHDHISTFLLLSALYFLITHLQKKSITNLILLGASLALSVGTNYSVGAYLPGFAVLLLVAWVKNWIEFKDIKILLVTGLVSFLLLSSPIYISNSINFGSPLGPDALSMTGQDAVAEGSTLGHILLLNGRWGYQLLDCGGLPQPLLGYCFKVKSRSFGWLSSASGISLEVDRSLLNQHQFRYSEFIPLSEDSAWFGVLGTLIFLGGGIFSIVTSVKKQKPFHITVVSFLLTIPIALALLRNGWTPYDGRYYIFLLALLCISAGEGLTLISKKAQKLFQLLVTIISIGVLCVTVLTNPAKAFYGYRAFYNVHRFDQISAQAYMKKEMLYLVDQAVPEDASLGIAFTTQDYFEYGLFGENFTRTIIPIHPYDQVCDSQWLLAEEIEYVLVDDLDTHFYSCELTGHLTYVDSLGQWLIYEID